MANIHWIKIWEKISDLWIVKCLFITQKAKSMNSQSFYFQKDFAWWAPIHIPAKKSFISFHHWVCVSNIHYVNKINRFYGSAKSELLTKREWIEIVVTTEKSNIRAVRIEWISLQLFKELMKSRFLSSMFISREIV